MAHRIAEENVCRKNGKFLNMIIFVHDQFSASCEWKAAISGTY